MRVPPVRVCLPDLNRCVAQRLSFQVRDAAAQSHELTGSPLLMSADKRQVGILITWLYTRVERAGYQVGRLAQNAILCRKQCGNTGNRESAGRK
jgi:hypothetical protein